MWENRMLQPWRMPLGPSFARKVPRSLLLLRLHTQPCFHANIGSLQAAINQQRISVQVLKMGHSHPNTGLLAARGDLGWKRGALLKHEGETAPSMAAGFSSCCALEGPSAHSPRCSSLSLSPLTGFSPASGLKAPPTDLCSQSFWYFTVFLPVHWLYI